MALRRSSGPSCRGNWVSNSSSSVVFGTPISALKADGGHSHELRLVAAVPEVPMFAVGLWSASASEWV
ncbi:hypothetical protein U1Q18_002810 [Sarracenia purpurea var. burkii]